MRVRGADEIEQQREADRIGLGGRLSAMDVPDGLSSLLRPAQRAIAVEQRDVIVHRLGDGIEIESLGGARLLEHEERQALLRAVAQPFVDREAVAFRFGNLLAVIVEEEFVIEAFRRHAAQRATIFDDKSTEEIRSLPAIS